MASPSLTVLSGGFGGARLAQALVESRLAVNTTFVTNVGDDTEVGDVLVCPDTDAVLYALSGRFDFERGWGVRGDTFPAHHAGAPAWFSIGRHDLVHHRRRRRLLDAGHTLAGATAALAARAHSPARVVPSSNDPVRTVIRSGDVHLGFQEWLVRDSASPRVDGVEFEGATHAAPADGVVAAIEGADLLVFASSSPIASLAPTLAIPGVANAVLRRTGPTVALSPVVCGVPPTSDRDRRRAHARAALLTAVGVAHTPVAVAAWLKRTAPSLTDFVLDPADAAMAERVSSCGVETRLAPVLARSPSERRRLVGVLLNQLG